MASKYRIHEMAKDFGMQSKRIMDMLEDIGIIQIQDISTFVEILNGKGERVYELLQKTPIKGRMRCVSKVDR